VNARERRDRRKRPWSAASLLSSDLSDEALAKSEVLAKEEDARPARSGTAKRASRVRLD
jgi:hypothetical protein